MSHSMPYSSWSELTSYFRSVFFGVSVAIVLCASQIVHAADGQLDLTFGSGGKVITPSSNIGMAATAVVIQPDGKVISVGYERVPVIIGFGVTRHFLLLRYNQNGILDTSFGNGGRVLTAFVSPPNSDSIDQAYAVSLQRDGKIIVVGSTNATTGGNRNFGLARYNTNGSLDPTFGDHGLVTTDFNGGPDEAYALAIQPDGKVVVGGTAAPGPNPDPNAGFYILKFALARYNVDGSLDLTFGSGGKVVPGLQGDVKGVTTSLAIHGLAIQSDGKIVVCGDVPWTLARFGASGNLDQSFGNGGSVTSFVENGGRAMAMAFQTDGKIIAGGYQASFVVARYKIDGSLDPSFGTGGKVTTSFKGGYDLAFALSLQNDGKVILAGEADNLSQYDVGVARYDTSGALDSTFGNGGKITTDFAGAYDHVGGMAVQSDGKIVVAGSIEQPQESVALARYTGTPFNSINETGFFVTEQYLDFLGRRPDQSGLDFWISNVTSCGNDAQCVEVKRINTSAAFFLSIEFQNTGYLVERIYKAAYGDATGTSGLGGTHQLQVPVVHFSEFLPDVQGLGQGVVVLQTGWEQQLENNKVAFTSEFVQRQRFTTAFPTTLTPAQFVDKLFSNAGVTPLSADRNAAINEFGGAANTSDNAARGRALRRVAENAILSQQEFNRAFVLMQYFGYLRRDPNSGQDADHTGYDFWLTKLNQFNGNYISAEMVKAFLSSIEYRQRFGT